MAGPWEKYADATPADAPWTKYAGTGSKPTQAKPAAKDEGYDPLTVGSVAGAALEPPLSMLTGSVAAPVSGLAGIAGALLPGPEGQGADWARGVGSALTYEPKSGAGKKALSTIGAPFAMLAKGADVAGEKVAGATGSPAAGAGLNALIQFLPQLLASNGIRSGRGVMDPNKPSSLVTPELERLQKGDTTPTIGQVGGPMAKRFEEGIERIPILAEPVRAAKARAGQEANIEQVNSALREAKLPAVPKGTPAGQKAIEHANDAFDERYADLRERAQGFLGRPKEGARTAGGIAAQRAGRAGVDMTKPALAGEGPKLLEGAPGGPLATPAGPPPRTINPPPGAPPGRVSAGEPTLWQDIERIKSEFARGNYPPEVKQRLERTLNREIINRFDKASGLASGDELKAMQSKVRSMSRTMGRNENPDVRQEGEALKQAADAIDAMIKRENPELAPEWEATDRGYAKFKIAQDAAARAASRGGVNTPAQFTAAVRSADKSKDKARTAKGEANQQDLANAMNKYLSKELPDSGTPYGIALMHMLMSAVQGKGGMTGIPGALLAATILGPLYSKGAQSGLTKLMTNSRQMGNRIGQALPFGLGQAMNDQQQ